MPDDQHHHILHAAFPGQQARYYLAMSLGGTPELADEFSALVLDGTKTATSSPLWDYTDGPRPFVGALSVLLDGQGNAVGVVETVAVQIVRFSDATEAMARAYGEGERTLAWFRRVIGQWYRDKAARDGQSFTEDDEILFEWIKPVARPPFESGPRGG